MRAFVFTDRALERHAGRFVWLSMDTEEPSAGPFLEKFPIDAWPTLMVIDPRTEQVALKWPGSATVAQLVKLLDDGERAVRGKATGLDAKLAALDKAFSAGRHDEAAKLGEALAAEAPKDWPGRPRAVELWLLSLFFTQKLEPCARTAAREQAVLPRGPPYLDVLTMGLACAVELGADVKDKAALVAGLEAPAVELLAKRDVVMAADDYSGLYMAVIDAREGRGDKDGAQAMTKAWSEYLDAEAEKAPTAEARAVFDPHRLTAYQKLGHPERAVPMLQASEKALPDDFNPPARLAVIYRELGKLPEALAATDRALARARGPRKLRIYGTRADILKKQGNADGAKKALDEGLAFAASLPRPQQNAGAIDALKKARAELK